MKNGLEALESCPPISHSLSLPFKDSRCTIQDSGFRIQTFWVSVIWDALFHVLVVFVSFFGFFMGLFFPFSLVTFAFLVAHNFRHISVFFLCSFDVRDKMNSDQARHWSAPEVFGSRAKFHFDSQPATLEIKVSTRIPNYLLIQQRGTRLLQSFVTTIIND